MTLGLGKCGTSGVVRGEIPRRESPFESPRSRAFDIRPKESFMTDENQKSHDAERRRSLELQVELLRQRHWLQAQLDIDCELRRIAETEARRAAR